MNDIVSVAKDFSPLPAGRYVDDGDGNGTTFRERFLEPALRDHREVVIDLDGAAGYPSSFLEEAFGGLVRKKFSPAMIRRYVHIRTSQPSFDRYIRKIWEHVERAAKATD